MEEESESKREALRLQSLAETKFKSSNLKSALRYARRAHRLCPSLDGLTAMITSLSILDSAAKSPPEYYKILQVEPFSHINVIRKQYKKLALALHPDKNPTLGSEDAFKVVGEAFRLLSDRVRRKEYDVGLRLRMQKEAAEALNAAETFWTACSRCRLLHQFERKYLGHSLVCPSCRKSFKAVEVEGEGKEGDSEGLKGGVRRGRLKRKAGSVDVGAKRKVKSEGRIRVKLTKKVGRGGGEIEGSKGDDGRGSGEWSGGRLRRRESRVRTGVITKVAKLTEQEEQERAEEGAKTLAEMQLEVKRMINKDKMKMKGKEKQKELAEKDDGGKKAEDDGKDRRQFSKKDGAVEVEPNQGVSKRSGALAIEIQYSRRKRNSKIRRQVNSDRRDNLEVEMQTTLPKKRRANLEHETPRGFLLTQRPRGSKSKDLKAMMVVDSDFYDFDKDRIERSFKKGQVWAVYDDIDGQPRHYCLVNEVLCLNPFEVRLSWLDVQDSMVEDLVGREKGGFHLSCGRFKVAQITVGRSLNIFSHVVDCERAAREIYRIYPRKGSVWAVFKEELLDAERRNLSNRYKCCYDIVICLTTYSEMHGLSMAYLEKVDGFKTVFQRREIGLHAIRWLEKGGVNLFSHQIPSRKLSGSDVPDALEECWELDPAALPSHLLTTRSQKLRIMPCPS